MGKAGLDMRDDDRIYIDQHLSLYITLSLFCHLSCRLFFPRTSIAK